MSTKLRQDLLDHVMGIGPNSRKQTICVCGHVENKHSDHGKCTYWINLNQQCNCTAFKTDPKEGLNGGGK